jgi:DNA-damage-inducible protein J
MAHVPTAGEAPKTGMIRARVDPDLKIRAEAILARLGLSASDAIRLFYTQITLSEGLPFEVRIPNAVTRKAIRDAMAGKNIKHYASTGELFEKLGI